MYLEIKEFVGKFIDKKGSITTDNKEYNEKLIEILELLDNEEFNEKEVSSFIGKLRKMTTSAFEITHPIIVKMLDSSKEDMKDEIDNLAEKLDLYVKRTNKEFTIDLIIEYMNELKSKIDRYSNMAICKMNKKLSKDEINLLNESIISHDEDTINCLKAPYREWTKNIADKKEIYDVLENEEENIPDKALRMLGLMLKKIYEDEERQAILYQINKKDTLTKAMRVHTNYHRKGFESYK